MILNAWFLFGWFKNKITNGTRVFFPWFWFFFGLISKIASYSAQVEHDAWSIADPISRPSSKFKQILFIPLFLGNLSYLEYNWSLHSTDELLQLTKVHISEKVTMSRSFILYIYLLHVSGYCKQSVLDYVKGDMLCWSIFEPYFIGLK